MSYRLYIDESGDHTYRHLDDPFKQFLGLTGVLIRKDAYEPAIPKGLEELKRRFFRYDADDPPILVRQSIIRRKGTFGRLNDRVLNAMWEERLLEFLGSLPMQVFTVVIDKRAHLSAYPFNTWNPYDYSLHVLLNRVRGFLKIKGEAADVMPESRGQIEDAQLLAAYLKLRKDGAKTAQGVFGTGPEYCEAFPEDSLRFRKKEHNVAGLQIADLVAADQKLLTIQESGKPMPQPIGPFGAKVNESIRVKVNRYGRYMLE